MEKKEWVTPAVESDSAFETLAGTCTAATEAQDGCATDGIRWHAAAQLRLIVEADPGCRRARLNVPG